MGSLLLYLVYLDKIEMIAKDEKEAARTIFKRFLNGVGTGYNAVGQEERNVLFSHTGLHKNVQYVD